MIYHLLCFICVYLCSSVDQKQKASPKQRDFFEIDFVHKLFSVLFYVAASRITHHGINSMMSLLSKGVKFSAARGPYDFFILPKKA